MSAAFTKTFLACAFGSLPNLSSFVTVIIGPGFPTEELMNIIGGVELQPIFPAPPAVAHPARGAGSSRRVGGRGNDW